MKVFIANFGRENHLWKDCLKRSTVATLEGEDVRPLRLAGDREAYVERTINTRRTARGILPTRAVASRWFNLAGIIENTTDDLWIHREMNDLWWTYSRAGTPEVVIQRAFRAADDRLPKERRCQILTNLGSSLSSIGRSIEALEAWNEALAIDSEFPMALANRAYGLFHYAKALYDEGHREAFLRYPDAEHRRARW